MTRRTIAEVNTYELVKNVDIVYGTPKWAARLLFGLCTLGKGRGNCFQENQFSISIPVLVHKQHVYIYSDPTSLRRSDIKVDVRTVDSKE